MCALQFCWLMHTKGLRRAATGAASFLLSPVGLSVLFLSGGWGPYSEWRSVLLCCAIWGYGVGGGSVSAAVGGLVSV